MSKTIIPTRRYIYIVDVGGGLQSVGTQAGPRLALLEACPHTQSAGVTGLPAVGQLAGILRWNEYER